METDTSEADLRRRVKERVQARIALGIHIALYVLVNLGLIAIWAASGAHYPWFMWPVFGWGVGIVAHVITYFYGPGSPGEDRAVARELRRLQTRTH